ncbi:hypothetical protein [Mycobacterium gordonae]|uniref:Uncharacterized protein n=1 Tax=Mycobacterium gordonae TaxID=1778 RepID=A0A1X1W879_MYCGO|nr:hypothetical protein [Mycobacterium gordonae]MCV7010092.1 hypothetical protein [Mycobacterium gordonae]ODR22717.1 hypothetical protein BHQ23_07795 [Mycobacterium gordonae]ORV82730.1 hypothetical protein AWC08_28495 [Mycobacterium gordonae]
MPTFAALDHDLPDAFELDHLERIGETRGQLLAHIAAGIESLQSAADTLDRLCSNTIYDADFIDGRDGRDVAAFLDEAIRNARATYAVVHAVIDNGVPR